ncbi:MAG: DUF4838 domain-containing protein, partial [Mameliella sp.]|nr:DUF4838 domain-containing protein [Phaeodactylibacter sp.]
MKNLLCFCCTSLLLLPFLSHAQVRIVENGQSKGRIVIDTSVTTDSLAAEVLKRFVGEMSGAELSILDFRNAGEVQLNDVLIGDFQRAKWEHPPVQTAQLKPDGFLLHTMDGHLRIVSGGGNGSIYAVVTLLDDYLGMDYFTKDTYTLTPQDNVELPAFSYEDAPAFTYRQTFSYGLEDPMYKLWFRLESPAEAFAGNLWVHTFDRLLPSDQFGESHPEYYSLIKGKRQPGKASQWCLTNEEVLGLVTQQLDSIFKRHPEKDVISVSQNDGNFTYCTCSSCAAIDEREESPSGTLIHFVNQLADRFPDKTISTLAYLYSMHPPKHLKPRSNVNIMLCSIDAKREVPLTDNATGQDFVKALKGWAEISDNIFVWDYGINFDNLVAPFPNFHVLQPNMELFHQHNVRMHFAQVGGKRGEDFSELRAYMISRLLWDPYQDADSLMLDFMEGYYGAAAPYLYQYQKMLEGALLSNDAPLWIYDTPVSHKEGMLRGRLCARYNELFDAAEATVDHDPELLRRVRRSRLPLQYAELEIARTRTARDPAQLNIMLDTFAARTARYEVKTLNERNNAPGDYCRLYRERYLLKLEGNLASGAQVSWLEAPAPGYLKGANTALTDELYGGT